MRESFKDLKKKFNNLKFNYMKKNEKSRNLKAVKNQIQQIEIYIEKLQVKKLSFNLLASFIIICVFFLSSLSNERIIQTHTCRRFLHLLMF